jgi:hypothetical protein
MASDEEVGRQILGIFIQHKVRASGVLRPGLAALTAGDPDGFGTERTVRTPPIWWVAWRSSWVHGPLLTTINGLMARTT